MYYTTTSMLSGSEDGVFNITGGMIEYDTDWETSTKVNITSSAKCTYKQIAELRLEVGFTKVQFKCSDGSVFAEGDFTKTHNNTLERLFYLEMPHSNSYRQFCK